ncbi:MAG TPA: threonine--tRNA ligase [Verrucomicrobiae bacterium]|nr:threonine--tRNA ligase [Verrucomicrobiae bacterium]
MEAAKQAVERKTLDQRERMGELQRVRHSAAHIMAAAVLRIWPETRLDIGPPTDEGFYYDFDLDNHRFSPEDFPRIEEEMRKIVKENQTFDKSIKTRDEARAFFEKREQKFKIERLGDIPEGETISFYQNGEFIDLCAGPHVMRTGNVKAFKLLKVASAYFRGNEKNPQLQRLYGTAFHNKTELDAWLQQQEEARKRDHRKIGKEMGLFTISQLVGPGLVLWMPKGGVLRTELQALMQEELLKRGYTPVYTPHIGSVELYKISGHFPYYKDSQYPTIKVADNEEYLLKPMNCPHHIQIYAAEPRSYRELPMRLAEFGMVYRYEQSGELSGMTRVRGFTQDDAHIFCTPDQVEHEFRSTTELVQHVFAVLGLTDYRVQVSVRDPKSDKYTGDPENWNKAEATLKKVASDMGLPHEVVEGEAAFYGPKLDFMVKDCLGREWQLGTVQLDYNLPERFQLEYIGSDNQRHRPVMIHRAPFGSFERFVGILIEHFAGNFPLWLAPEQVRVLALGDGQNAYAQGILDELRRAGVRAEIDISGDKIGAKIRNAELAKVHTMFIVGGKEQEADKVAIRVHGKGDQGAQPRAAAISQILSDIKARKL